MRPLTIRGRTVHVIGLPYHWSYLGRVRGDPANELIAFVADPNVQIQESKALTGAIVPGRSSRGRRSATDGATLREPEVRDVLRDRPAIAAGRSGHTPTHPR
jgi:formate dehydrogenase major subunit